MSFKDLAEFQYKGKLREVRIWDEAMLPAQELTLSANDIASLGKVFERRYPGMSRDVIKWAGEIQGLSSGEIFKLPNLEERYSATEQQVMESVTKEPTRVRETVKTFFALAEKPCVIRKDGNRCTAIDYKDFLPSDFYPVIVLDASGRVRTTYKFWEECRKGLVKLKTAKKTYQNLRCHVWNASGGKGSFGRDESTKVDILIDGIVDLIESKPDEEFLVVSHKHDDWKKGGVPDIASAINGRVSNPQRVKHLTWGNEKASNDYRNVPNVVLAGTLFYPAVVYETRARASMGLSSEERLAPARYREIELGEHMNLILQAACRGSCRVSVDGDCKPMDLYVIATKNSGIPAALYEVFPGMPQWRPWNPVPQEPTGKVLDALRFIEEQKGKGESIYFTKVMDAIGMKGSGNFKNRVRQHPKFVTGLMQLGLVEQSSKGGVRYDCFAEPPTIGNWEDEIPYF